MQALPPVPAEPPAAVDTVVVTAPRLPPSPGDAAFSIIRLNADLIAAQPRLDDALEEVPGVSLFRRTSSAAENPTTQGVGLRSIGPSGAGRALVTLDGVPQNDPFGGWVIWTSLPSEAITGAQVVRGAGAGPYGAGALTGVVALEEMSRPGALDADASVAQLGGRRGALATAQAIGPTELFVSASGEETDGWTPVRYGSGAADDNLSLKDWSAAARLQGQVGPALAALRVSAYQEDRDAGLVGAQSTAKGQIASLTFAAQPGPGELGWRLQAWVHHSNLQNSSVSVAAGRGSTTPANNQFSTPATGWGANAALRGTPGPLTWEIGFDVRGVDGEEREDFRNLGAGFTRQRVAGGQTLVAGGYVEASLVSGAWLFTGGGRLDGWFQADGLRIETNIATGAVTFQDHPGDRSGTVPSGRVGVKRDLGAGVYLRAAAYSSFRPPTLNELYRPFRVGNAVTEANAALVPERLYGAEAGLGGAWGGLVWDATVFVNRLNDAVTNVTIGFGPASFPGFPQDNPIPAGGSLAQRQNAGAIVAEGAEVDASYAVDSRLTLHAAADYTHAVVHGGTTAPQLTGLRPAQAPRIIVTAGADWQVVGPFSLHGQLRYEGVRYDDDLNTHPLAPATVVDARLDWRINRFTTVYVGADNLFDANVQTAVAGDGSISYDAPRIARIGVTFRQ